MRAVDPKTLHEIEEMAREVGALIGEATRRQAQAKGIERYGFALMMFSFAGPEFTWISNAEREDMIKVLKEFIQQLKAGTADELSRPKGRG